MREIKFRGNMETQRKKPRLIQLAAVAVPTDFIKKVREMRAAQREFKEHLTYGHRNRAIALEKEVDKMLEEMDYENN